VVIRAGGSAVLFFNPNKISRNATAQSFLLLHTQTAMEVLE